MTEKTIKCVECPYYVACDSKRYSKCKVRANDTFAVIKEKSMNLHEIILNEILTDDTDTEFISARLIKDYYNSALVKKRIIDDVFITLTGWTLKTLIERASVKNKKGT